MRRRALRLGAALILAALAACRTVPPPPQGIAWEARRPQLQGLAHFALQGRVAVATAGEGFNASLRWVQQGTRSQVTLEGPLGVGATQITAAGDELSVTTARGETVGNEAARAELASRLGFDPPIAALRYWVLGVPDPAEPAQEALDPSRQHLTALTQSGWRIDYNDYMNAEGQALPARLTLQRDTVRVRLVVDRWQP
jgi:outer membrane lipoprotein LolB